MMAFISITTDVVVIGNRNYKPDENLAAALIEQIQPELGEHLKLGEVKARDVAKAIRRLGIQAIRECLNGDEESS